MFIITYSDGIVYTLKELPIGILVIFKEFDLLITNILDISDPKKPKFYELCSAKWRLIPQIDHEAEKNNIRHQENKRLRD